MFDEAPKLERDAYLQLLGVDSPTMGLNFD